MILFIRFIRAWEKAVADLHNLKRSKRRTKNIKNKRSTLKVEKNVLTLHFERMIGIIKKNKRKKKKRRNNLEAEVMIGVEAGIKRKGKDQNLEMINVNRSKIIRVNKWMKRKELES